jgi:DNA-binding CsgD family transcriptional regulator
LPVFGEKAMTLSAANGEFHGRAERMRSPDCQLRALNVIRSIRGAESVQALFGLYRHALDCLGADAAVFTSYLRDDATRSSYRSLPACDPVWASEYAKQGWCEDDPWLRYAAHDTEPIRSSKLALHSPREQEFTDAASLHGFASAVIVPAPTSLGLSRVGVLSLGSATPGYFDDDEGYGTLRILARALAMELHAWLRQSVRDELLIKSRLTTADIELLRHEAAGHTSKVIAAMLHTEAKTIDCRFQRVSAKLDAPNRRVAVRIARLYGLI